MSARTKPWSLVAIAKQAITIYGELEKCAIECDDLQSQQFYRGHRVTVEAALKAHRKRLRVRA